MEKSGMRGEASGTWDGWERKRGEKMVDTEKWWSQAESNRHLSYAKAAFYH